MDKIFFITNNFRETVKLGRDFAKTLKKGDVVCLYGELGSGKTTFTKGLAEGLGIEQRIISPTFVFVREHKINLPAGKAGNHELGVKKLYHIDLYRIEKESDIHELGLEEILSNKDNIVVIEWAEKMKNFLPAKRIDIMFSHEKNNARKISFSSL